MSDVPVEYAIRENLIYFTTDFYEMIQTNDPTGDALRVFIHLFWTARKQGNRAVWATSLYLHNGVHMAEDRVKAAKKKLKDLGLIEYKAIRSGQRIVRWLVVLNINLSQQVSTGVVSTPVEAVPGRETPPEVKKENKENQEQENKEIQDTCYASPSPSVPDAVAVESVPEPKIKKVVRRKSDDPPNPAIPVLQRYYVQKFTAKVGTMPNMPYAQSGANLKALLKLHTADQVQAVMDLFFDYEKRTCFAWTRFMNAFDNLVGRAVNGGNGHKANPEWERQKEIMHDIELDRVRPKEVAV